MSNATKLPQSHTVSEITSFSDALREALELHRRGELDHAEVLYRRMLADRPSHADLLHLLGLISHQRGKSDVAVELISKAIAINPLQAAYKSNLGNALRELKRFDEALSSYDQAIRIKDDYASAFYNRGNLLKELDRLDESLASYDKAIELQPDYAIAYNNRANLLKDLQRLPEALANYNTAIEIKPDYADAFNNRGNLLKLLGRLEESLSSYDAAVRLSPKHADALNNRGNVLKELGRLDEALVSYEAAISVKPNFASAFYNRGNILKELKKFDEALASYDEAIRLKSDHASAFNNRGNLLKEIRRYDEALSSYDAAIRLKPGYADAINNRGNVLKELRRFEEALATYDDALRVQIDYPFAAGMAAHVASFICRWSDLPQRIANIASGITEGRRVTAPFPLLSLVDDPVLQRRAAEIYVNNRHIPSNGLGELSAPQPDTKIRVAYLSADFHNHATSYLIAELLESHDRKNFEIIGISFGPNRRDEMRKRVEKAFDRFFDVREMNDISVARLCREIGVDIAVDLKGFTQDSRTGILAERCAPVQINWLGYPGSMGAPFIDYIVADKVLINDENRKYYAEKVIRMPDSYQVNDTKRAISKKNLSRADCHLPETGFIFCCFNNNYKILPETFDVWMSILSKVPESALWLLADNPLSVANLRNEASKRGIDPARLVFADRLPLKDHLARHELAGLFLDTWPYNAHTTASDALWAGLPLITLLGNSFPSRVAASALEAAGCPELITRSEHEYENLAVTLANSPELLLSIKERLTKNRATTPLFDTIRFTKNLEAAYRQVTARYRAGMRPDHLDVPP